MAGNKDNLVDYNSKNKLLNRKTIEVEVKNISGINEKSSSKNPYSTDNLSNSISNIQLFSENDKIESKNKNKFIARLENSYDSLPMEAPQDLFEEKKGSTNKESKSQINPSSGIANMYPEESKGKSKNYDNMLPNCSKQNKVDELVRLQVIVVLLLLLQEKDDKFDKNPKELHINSKRNITEIAPISQKFPNENSINQNSEVSKKERKNLDPKKPEIVKDNQNKSHWNLNNNVKKFDIYPVVAQNRGMLAKEEQKLIKEKIHTKTDLCFPKTNFIQDDGVDQSNTNFRNVTYENNY